MTATAVGAPHIPTRNLLLTLRQKLLAYLPSHPQPIPLKLKSTSKTDDIAMLGSSSTPMFGETGKVVGISFVVGVDDTASNFAVGTQGAIEQLRRAGWTDKQPS